MNVSIIAIGDELLIGQVIDTNSGDIARMIQPAGWKVDYVQVVHDDADAIRDAIDAAFEISDVVLTTGGLGPTKDDITKQTLCDYFGGTLQHDPTVLDNIKEIFRRRGIVLNPLTEAQAMVPTSCRVIQNRVGTAPIMWFERDGKVLVSMPGVPFETHQMFEAQVFPQLLKKFHSDVAIGHRTLIVEGLTESAVAIELDKWEQAMPQFTHLAYLPKPGIIRLRIDGIHHDEALLNATLDDLHAQLCRHFKDNLLCDSDLTPEESLIKELRSRGLTVASAESCTGGNIAHHITSIAGCSDVYVGSVVSYANHVKQHLLGVNEATLQTYGAVSQETALEMVNGVAKATGADCAIATTGIAGPSGATDGKPVGTVCIAVKTPSYINAETFHFPGTRDRVIDRATTTALTRLCRAIQTK
jgi:nicotinamide-nucleotide amidase